jgi:diguanylate cyclase (GGDEF)-like protein
MDGRHDGSWLCRDALDRDRLVDMEHRLKPVRTAAVVLLGGALVASGPWVGWWTIVPLVVVSCGWELGNRRLDLRTRPEYPIAMAWLFTELLIATSIALTGGPDSPAVAWLAIPVVALPARFTERGILAGVLIAAGLMLAVTVSVDPHRVAEAPQLVIYPMALLGAVTLLSMALMRSDLQHRSEAVVDPLTGMLNRNALAVRVSELTQQASLSGDPVGVVVADLDRFKQINDDHGHATGDAVLMHVACRMREVLRAFDLVYRLGGEEFLILLPGADVPHAADVAERLREAVAAEPIAGVAVTLSCGVAASHGQRFDFDEVISHADAALYAAKHAGRDSVRIAARNDPAAGLVPA